MAQEIKFFRFLIISNALVSLALTVYIFLYNIEFINIKSLLVLLYALMWFYSLYKIYNFSKLGLKLYISLVIMGLLFNILSNLQVFSKFYYIISLFEHIVIGSLLAFSYFLCIVLISWIAAVFIQFWVLE